MPALSLNALRAQLKSRKLAPVYALVGEDTKLVDRMVDVIEETIDEADRPFAVERVYAGETGGSPLDIAAAARVYPMLGDRRVVVVLRAERLLKPKRGGKAAMLEEDGAPPQGGAEDSTLDFAPLEEYLAAPVPSTTLVFVATEMDKGRRFTKRLIEKALVVEFGGLGAEIPGRRDPRPDAVALVREELAREGRTIDPAALNLLVDRSGGDVTKLRSDIERLVLYTEGRPRVAADDVVEIASPDSVVADDWAVVNAIGDGDAGRALREAGARLDRSDSPHALLGQLRWWVSNRLPDTAPNRVAPAIEALLKTDLALKSSAGEERVLIERLVVELCRPNLSRASGADARRAG